MAVAFSSANAFLSFIYRGRLARECLPESLERTASRPKGVAQIRLGFDGIESF